VLGVNGYIWISKHVDMETDAAGVSITRLEESVSAELYSNRNEEIEGATRREIARVSGCIKALVESGLRVDEETVMRAYEASLFADTEMMNEEEGHSNEGSDYLGGQKGRRIARAVLDQVRR
jgi:exosome complex component RRP4